MKVLVVSHTYVSPINREKWIVFSQKYPNIDVKVLIPNFWPATLFDLKAGDLKKYNSKNCEFISIDTFRTGNEVLYGYRWRKLAKLLRAFNPDLVHVEQGDNAFSYFQLIFLSKLFLKKTKFTFFTWVNWKEKRSLKYKMFWQFIEKINLYFSDAAFVGNQRAREILQLKKFKKPIKVLLQLGVNEKVFVPAKKVEHKKTKYVCFIGRIIEQKGIFLLVDAFADLAKRYKDWNLKFVGNGDSYNKLISYISKKKLTDRIEFNDVVKHEKISKILRKIDILVLPSFDTPKWKEQFGHVLIEAMATKIPVVGSSAGNIPNVIGSAGLVFEQKNKNYLKKCLERLMCDEKLRQTIGEKGYQRYQNEFSYNVIAEKMYQFWEEKII
ncbi:glycosyltransferase [Candidatus Dependentiae bacterium]